MITYRILRMRVLSATLAKKVHARDKDCFMNSMKALMVMPKQTGIHTVTAAYYVEGVAVTEYGILVCHGWNEIEVLSRRGQRATWVLDTTPVYHVSKRPVKYFAGPRWTIVQLQAYMGSRATTSLPLVGYAELKNPEYRTAYNAAHVNVYGCTLDEMMTTLHSIKLPLKSTGGA